MNLTLEQLDALCAEMAKNEEKTTDAICKLVGLTVVAPVIVADDDDEISDELTDYSN